MRPKLTKRQQEVLDFIVRSIQDQGFPPSIREIQGEFGIRSPNGANHHLVALERKGYIRREPGVARSITVETGFRTRIVTLRDGNAVSVAGVRIEADEKTKLRITFPRNEKLIVQRIANIPQSKDSSYNQS